jgi:hypothetical protein
MSTTPCTLRITSGPTYTYFHTRNETEIMTNEYVPLEHFSLSTFELGEFMGRFGLVRD